MRTATWPLARGFHRQISASKDFNRQPTEPVKLFLLIVLYACHPNLSVAAPSESRAAKLFEWCERGEWFELPRQWVPGVGEVPIIGSGTLVPDSDREASEQRYLHELDYHAEVISRCGAEAVDVSLEKLRSADPYIVIIAARALDKLLGYKSEIWIDRKPPVAHMQKVYRQRADLCFPDRGREPDR